MKLLKHHAGRHRARPPLGEARHVGNVGISHAHNCTRATTSPCPTMRLQALSELVMCGHGGEEADRLALSPTLPPASCADLGQNRCPSLNPHSFSWTMGTIGSALPASQGVESQGQGRCDSKRVKCKADRSVPALPRTCSHG